VQDEKAAPLSELTIFVRAGAALRERLRAASVDRREFERRLTRCKLADCHGVCCHDGVPVDDDTARSIESLARTRAADFNEMGLSMPEEVIVENQWQGVVSKKTAVRSFAFRSRVAGYPSHFPETACVFLLDDGRCGLQILAQRDDKHPWYYKPFACWLHPIKITGSAIHLYDETSDPNRYPDYDGFVCRTFCGRTAKDGSAAGDLLEDELRYLGRILGRDLLAELAAGHGADEGGSAV
jgi:Protein of unknown function (DUF3109)